MELVDVFEELLNNHTIKDWVVSLNDVRKGPVTHGAIGLAPIPTFWASFTFEVDGATHKFDVTRRLTGGDSSIILDGKKVTGGHVTLKKHLVGFPPELRAEIDIVVDDKQRYRFDGSVT